MNDGAGYVIELAGEPAGLVVREGNRFRFYASSKNYAALERRLYRTPGEAEHACRRMAFPGRMPRPGPRSRAGLLAGARRPVTA